jgi:hypothetical protein
MDARAHCARNSIWIFSGKSRAMPSSVLRRWRRITSATSRQHRNRPRSRWRLHQAPIYFQKKGKGRYKAAPAETLAAAKLGLERKAREAATRAEWVAMLVRGELPDSIRVKVFELAHKPDKNSLEFKALSDACAETNLSVVRLLDRCGAIPSSLEYHRQAFLLTHFPRGLAFPDLAAPLPPPELPAAMRRHSASTMRPRPRLTMRFQ